MSCQVPHVPWNPQSIGKGPDNKISQRQRLLEKQLLPDGRLACPNIGFSFDGSLGVITPDEDRVQQLAVDLTKCLTIPVPVFLPTNSKSRRDPCNERFEKHHEALRKKAEKTIAYECGVLKANNPMIALEEIENAWKQYLKGDELPVYAKSLETVMKRHGRNLVKSPESYVGGNIATVWKNNKRYLIHFATKEHYSLCLTKVSTKKLKDRFIDVTSNYPIEGGTVYQVALPRQFNQQDSEALQQEDVIFATRQLHTTQVWKLKKKDGQPYIERIQEYHDPDSNVNCIDFNAITRGELCELRNRELIISKNGFLEFRKDLEKNYNQCIYAIHPKTVLLCSRRDVHLLDMRSNRQGNPHLAFTISDPGLRMYCNTLADEKIHSFSPSSRDNIFFMGTETSLLIWDVRMGFRPITKMDHFMDHPPFWITSVQVNSEKDWVFLDSEYPVSSGIVGLGWTSQRLCLDPSSDSMPFVNFEYEPKERSNISNTIDVLQTSTIKNNVGMDWYVENRLNEFRTGLFCDKGGDGVVHIWQCNAVGDVFVQQLNLANTETELETSTTVMRRLAEWSAAIQVDEVSSTVEQNEQTCLTDVLERMESTLELDNDSRENQECFAPDMLIPDDMEQSYVDKIHFVDDHRCLKRFPGWTDEEAPAAQETLVEDDDTFHCDSDDDTFPSTPLHSTAKDAVFVTSTPANYNQRKSSTPNQKLKKAITSTPALTPLTPYHATTLHSGGSPPKSQSAKPKVWDDF